jgi:hypothetical protein
MQNAKCKWRLTRSKGVKFAALHTERHDQVQFAFCICILD